MFKSTEAPLKTGTVKSVNVSPEISILSYGFFVKVYSNGTNFIFYYNMKEGGTVKMTGQFEAIILPGSAIQYAPFQEII